MTNVYSSIADSQETFSARQIQEIIDSISVEVQEVMIKQCENLSVHSPLVSSPRSEVVY